MEMPWGSLVKVGVDPLTDGVNPMWRWHRRPSLYEETTRYLQDHQPDVVFAHTLPFCVSMLEAASNLGIPIVFSVLDFSHICGRSFLVDAENRPCSGPESVSKCRACLQADHPAWRQLGMRLAESTVGKKALRTLLGEARAESFNLREGVEEAFSIMGLVPQWVDTWLVTSGEAARILGQYGVPEGNIERTPSFGLEEDRLEQAPGPPPLDGRRLRLGYFGRISPEKGVLMLADVLGEVADDAVTWVIISYDVDQETKDRLRRRSGLQGEQIKFVEERSGAELNAPLARLDVCVISSLWPETGPLTLLEAMAQGVPCICNDRSANARFIDDGENGRVFETGNKEALRRAVSEVLRNPETTREWREHIGEIEPAGAYTETLCRCLDRAATNGA
jgi:glycosyltransferase involved in cell wall biosynthesis